MEIVKYFLLLFSFGLLGKDLMVSAGSSTCFCHRGWIRHGDFCYLFSESAENWNKAQSSCQAHGAKLAEVETSEESIFLKDNARVRHHDFWLGGRDDVTEGVWVWSSNARRVTYTDWTPGQPDEQGPAQDCLYLWHSHDFRWDDAYCSDSYMYICEKDYTDFCPGFGKK